MAKWAGGVDWLLGLRIIPETSSYRIPPDMVDVLINDIDGTVYRCTVVSKYARRELACFQWEQMVDLLQERFNELQIPVTIAGVKPKPWVTGRVAVPTDIPRKAR